MKLPFYFPDPVQEFIAVGGNSFVGLVNKNTVSKYPRIAGDESAIASLQVEAQSQKDEGILLEYAPHGSLARYLLENQTTEQQRLKWSHQAIEAIVVIHGKGVIHCNIKVGNLLLDIELKIKLCDFQGRLLGSEGKVLSGGGSSENPKCFMLRDGDAHADFKTDIFALASTIFHILEGHGPFPELDSFDDEDEIAARFSSGRYPEPKFICTREAIHKCWGANYISAAEVLHDFIQFCETGNCCIASFLAKSPR